MRGRPKVFDKLGGGVNLVDGYNSGVDEAEDALNVRSDGLGGWESRKGSFIVLPDVLPPGFQASKYGIFKWDRGSEGRSSMMVVYQANRPLSNLTNATTFHFARGIDPAIPTAFTEILDILGTGSNAYTPPQFIVAPVNGGQGPVYFMNDQDSTTPYKKYWTGTGASADWTASSGTIPSGQFLIYANNRVMILEKEGKLTASDVGNPRAWDLTAGAWQVSMPPNGERGTGLGVAGDYVLVFQESMCWVVFDSETGANRRLDDAPGCGSHWSIKPSPFGTFFLGSDRRVYRTDGQSTKNVGRKIQPLLDTIRLPLAATPENDAARGSFVEDSYYLSGKFGNDELTLEYNVKTDSWWIHSGLSEMVTLDDTHYMPAGGGVCNALALGESLDASDPFVSRWRASRLAFGSPGTRSRVRAVDMDGSGDGVQAGMAKDGAAAILDPTSPVAANRCPDPQGEHGGILWSYDNTTGAGGDPSFFIEQLDGTPALPPLTGVDKAYAHSDTKDAAMVFFQAPVKNGSQYTLSMYVYLDTIGSGATGVRLEARNAAGTTKASSSTFTTLDTWTRLSLTFTADSTQTWKLGLAAVGNGAYTSAFVTAVLLELGASMSAYPLGANRDLGNPAGRRVLAPGVAKTWALQLESNRQIAMKSWTAWVDPRKD